MLGERDEIGIVTRLGEDRRVAFRKNASALSLEGPGHHVGPAPCAPVTHLRVEKGHEVNWEANSDLAAHPKMVPN